MAREVQRAANDAGAPDVHATLTSRECRGKIVQRQDLRGSARNLRHVPLKRERSCTSTEVQVRDLDNIVAEAHKKIRHGYVAMADSMTVHVLKAGEQMVRVPPRMIHRQEALRRNPQMMQARVVMLEHDVHVLRSIRRRQEEAVQMEYVGVRRQSEISFQLPGRFGGIFSLCFDRH